MLLTNISTLVLLVALLTLVPLLPGWLMTRMLTRGLAAERADAVAITR